MIRLRTLGSLSLQDDNGRELHQILAQPKRVALLIYLAAAKPLRVHRRDTLFPLFWPELDEGRARDALNQALHVLRQALGSEAFLRRGADEVGIDPGRLWCDAVAFRNALEGGQPAEAMDYYRGAFLEGFFIEQGGGFEDWMERERAEFMELAAQGARQLAEKHEAEGALTLAMSWGRQAVELAPDDERALRRLLRIYEKGGDKAGALRLYERFVTRLKAEYDTEPAPETQAVAEGLRRAIKSATSPTEPRPGSEPPARDLRQTQYRIERELGAGGMARVYLARDLKHDREVALKVLRPEIAEGLARERFVREIRIASRLQHPNIVPLFDSGEADGSLYFVMPHVQGESLRELLARGGRLPIDDVIGYGRELASALAHAHGHGIVHRDIKPANILLTDHRALLADFGIARAAQVSRHPEQPMSRGLTLIGTTLGTPGYMAPEQVIASADVDHRADLYSLGVVIFEMLTGRLPFEGTTSEHVFAAQLAHEAPRVKSLRSETPEWLDSMVAMCLERDKTKRPTRAESLVIALDGTPHPAPDRPITRRSTVLLPFVGALGVVLAAVAVLTLTTWRTRGRAGSEAVDIAQVAVRSFADMSTSGEFRRKADALSLEVIGELAKIPALRVRSATSTAPLRDASPDSLYRALGIGTLIEGTVAGDADSIRVSVSVVAARTSDELGRRKWVLSRTGLERLEDSLAPAIAGFVRDRLASEMRARRTRLATRSASAWEHFQMGAMTFDEAKRAFLNGDLGAAIKLLKVADSLYANAESNDPTWADPTLARGWTSHWRGKHSVIGTSDTVGQWFRTAIRHSERVLSRNPGHPEAHELRGAGYILLIEQQGADSTSLAVAERELRLGAVPENPAQARAWYGLARALRFQAKTAEAKVAAHRAYELDRFLEIADDLLAQLCATSFQLNQVADTRRWCNEGRKRFPNRIEFPYHTLELMTLATAPAEDADSAWAVLHELERAMPPTEWPNHRPGYEMLVAGALARIGLVDSARAVLFRARRGGTGKMDLPAYEAVALTALGDTVGAIRSLRAFLTNAPLMRSFVGSHPSFSGLAPHPEFQHLTKVLR